MRRPGIGTYLAQGAAANAIALWLLLIGIVLVTPHSQASVDGLYFAPLYLGILAFLGAVVGCFLWLFEAVISRKVGFWWRLLAGIAVPGAITGAVAWKFDSPFYPVLIILLAALLMLMLPALLLSGSPLNPLRSILLGFEPAPPLKDFGRAFSFLPGALLRFGSVLGLLDAMIYLAGLPSEALRDWQLGGSGFLETIVAILYFGITALVSFGLPRKRWVLLAALISNLPLALWWVDPTFCCAPAQDLSRVVGISAGLWFVFTLGRLLAIDEDSIHQRGQRILPVTFFEIRIRHALNHW